MTAETTVSFHAKDAIRHKIDGTQALVTAKTEDRLVIRRFGKDEMDWVEGEDLGNWELDPDPPEHKPWRIPSPAEAAKTLRFSIAKGVETARARRLEIEEESGPLTEAERLAEIVTLEQLRRMPPARWLVDGIIRQRSLTFLYGRPDTFKTFLALDLCGAIMTKTSWLEAEMLGSGPVLYIPAEGSETLTERLRAWEIQHDRSVPKNRFCIATSIPDLSSEGYIELLCQALKSRRSYVAVVIDTFGKSLGQADENSNSDVNQAMVAVSRLKALGVAVIMIHHSGHSAERLRGASAMPAAVDTIIKAQVVGDLMVKVSCERQRRSRKFDPFYVQLKEVEVGTDDLGRPETSLAVVGRVSKMAGAAAEHESRRQSVLDYLQDKDDHEAPQADIVRDLDLSMNGSARKAFFKALADDGLIEKAAASGKALTWRLAG
jgi:hypothetical protein